MIRTKRLSAKQMAALEMMVHSKPSRRFTVGEEIDPNTAGSLMDAGLVAAAWNGKEIVWATPLARQLVKAEA